MEAEVAAKATERLDAELVDAGRVAATAAVLANRRREAQRPRRTAAQRRAKRKAARASRRRNRG